MFKVEAQLLETLQALQSSQQALESTDEYGKDMAARVMIVRELMGDVVDRWQNHVAQVTR